MDRPELAVVIVNHNTRDLLARCLETLEANLEPPRKEVWVVDNGSTDDSAALVAERFPWVRLLRSDANLGFAAANNLALRRLRPFPPYVLLLNPDTELPPHALRWMVGILEAAPRVGIAGPRLIRPDGSLDLACRRAFPTPESAFWKLTGLAKLFPRSPRFGRYNLTYLDPLKPALVDSVVGAFMLIRGEALEQAGLLDEGFFMYGEDLDLAYRIKQRGWQVLYYPGVTVLHRKGSASRRRPFRSIVAFYHAMWRFHRKHYARRYPLAVNLLVYAGILVRGGIALLANALRPPAKRTVGDATPVEEEVSTRPAPRGNP